MGRRTSKNPVSCFVVSPARGDRIANRRNVLSPLRGFDKRRNGGRLGSVFPRLTPWAIICRPLRGCATSEDTPQGTKWRFTERRHAASTKAATGDCRGMPGCWLAARPRCIENTLHHARAPGLWLVIYPSSAGPQARRTGRCGLAADTMLPPERGSWECGRANACGNRPSARTIAVASGSCARPPCSGDHRCDCSSTHPTWQRMDRDDGCALQSRVNAAIRRCVQVRTLRDFGPWTLDLGLPFMRILGIDPGLERTGYGVVELAGGVGAPRLVEAGDHPHQPQRPVAATGWSRSTRALAAVMEEFRPEAVAIEELYAHYAHPRTAILMGHARGVVILAAAQAGVPVDELRGHAHQEGADGQRPCRQGAGAAGDSEPLRPEGAAASRRTWPTPWPWPSATPTGRRGRRWRGKCRIARCVPVPPR